jgi:hypothetical protein
VTFWTLKVSPSISLAPNAPTNNGVGAVLDVIEVKEVIYDRDVIEVQEDVSRIIGTLSDVDGTVSLGASFAEIARGEGVSAIRVVYKHAIRACVGDILDAQSIAFTIACPSKKLFWR